MPRGWPYSTKVRGETNTIVAETTNLSIRETFPNVFGPVDDPVSYFINLKITADRDLTFRFNGAGAAAVSVAVAEYPFEVRDAKITDIFVTNASELNNAELRIEGAGI